MNSSVGFVHHCSVPLAMPCWHCSSAGIEASTLAPPPLKVQRWISVHWLQWRLCNMTSTVHQHTFPAKFLDHFLYTWILGRITVTGDGSQAFFSLPSGGSSLISWVVPYTDLSEAQVAAVLPFEWVIYITLKKEMRKAFCVIYILSMCSVHWSSLFNFRCFYNLQNYDAVFYALQLYCSLCSCSVKRQHESIIMHMGNNIHMKNASFMIIYIYIYIYVDKYCRTVHILWRSLMLCGRPQVEPGIFWA